MKQFQNYARLSLFIFGLFFANGCDKNSPSSSLPEHSPIVRDRTEGCTASQYSQYGQQFHEYLTYDFAYVEPTTFLPEEYRNGFMVKFDSLRTLAQGWSYETLLNHLDSENTISPQFKQAAIELKGVVSTIFSSTPDLSNAILTVQNLTQAKINDTSISCEDKKLIVAYYSIAEKLFVFLKDRYGEELDTPNRGIALDRDCTFFERVGCFFETFLMDAVIGLSIGVDIFDSVIMDIAGAIAGLLIGAAVGVVHGLIVAIDGAQCCPQALACSAVMGASLKFSNCDAVAEYTAFGFGVDNTFLGWANDGGTPAAAVTPTSAPRLTITQTSPAIPVKTVISSSCKDGSIDVSGIFERNLADLSRDVYDISILGPTATPSESELPIAYHAIGINPSRYEVVTWFATNGEVVESNALKAKILWDNTKEEGTVFMRVRNICPNGRIKTVQLKVQIGAL